MYNYPKGKCSILDGYNLSKVEWIFDNDKVIPDLLNIYLIFFQIFQII